MTGEVKNTGTYVSWSQNSIIDLFYNRTSGLSDQVAPGSSGFYRFQLENTRSRDLNITLTLTEGKIHLPLKVTLTPLDSNGTPLTQQAVSGSIINGKLSLQGKISAKGRTTYRLDWAWPFEGNDKTDTAVGKAGGVYTLNLQIYAAER